MGIKRYQVVHRDDQEIVEEIYKIVVHRIRLGDVEDPDIFIAEPIWQWQQSDAGKFVMENSVTTPQYHQTFDASTFGYLYAITAELEKKKLSEYYLRWGKVNGNY